MKTRKTFYEQNGGTYTQVGDVLLPDLTIGEAEQKPIGKYGQMRKRYLKEQHPLLYSELLLSGKLYPHLLEIERIQKYTALDELTPYVAHELIKAIYVGAPDKSNGKRRQSIHIEYDLIGFIPLNELMKQETA